ncbi:MAG: ATP-binding protein [Vicinamibacterales bacterium]
MSGRRHERRGTHRERRETLLGRLAEAEETLRALRSGEVDALVVRGAGGDQIYTLHGAEEPYRNLVDQMREGAVVLAQSGDILYSNARFAALVGTPQESVLGAQIDRFIAPDDRGDFAVLLGSGNGTRRCRLISSQGTTTEVYFSLTTTVSSVGQPNLSLIVTDLSELLQARSERDRAERDSHTKNEFLAMLAHELRNPLGAIRSAVAVLEAAEPNNRPATRALAVMTRQVSHLSHLIDDLLDVERVASGKIRLDRQPLDIAETMRRVVDTFTGNAESDRRIEISTEPTWVEGDAVRLEQVFANILMNAIKYTPPGGVIQVSVRGDSDAAVLSVEDTGVGIAPDLLPSIFEMFVQGERTLDRAQGGLGIGLTLVRRLVELHGGMVTASSNGIGSGSTFTVRLPRVTATVATSTGVSSLRKETRPKRVLLIEDSRDARDMFRMLLELAGHTVYEAENGHHGLELLETVHPEAAVIDIGLPGLDGYEVARRIRMQPRGRAMLLLALTGYGFPSDYERSAAAGFDHHLIKPVDPDELTRLLGESEVNLAAAQV